MTSSEAAPTIKPDLTNGLPSTSIVFSKSWPLLKNTNVGIAVIPNNCPKGWFLSKSTFNSLINPSSANFSNIGAINLQGPHHSRLRT